MAVGGTGVGVGGSGVGVGGIGVAVGGSGVGVSGDGSGVDVMADGSGVDVAACSGSEVAAGAWAAGLGTPPPHPTKNNITNTMAIPNGSVCWRLISLSFRHITLEIRRLRVGKITSIIHQLCQQITRKKCQGSKSP